MKGAREHNLKNISLNIPRNQLVVVTGLSGSGKSSLAFDTIYAEGQRRYLESLSAYARQFLSQMNKPDVDSIEGLSPSISIEQKNTSRNPRSTVGTITEIYDFLRLLYARAGQAHCYSCGKVVTNQTVSQIVEQICSQPKGARFSVLAPLVRGKKGEYQKEMQELRTQGYTRVKIDGEELSLAAPIKLKKSYKHDISVYVDRLVLKDGIETRLAEALETSIKLSSGLAEVEFLDPPSTRLFSTQFACSDCGISFPEIEPRSFSFNSAHGWCETCEGLGTESKFDPVLVVPNPGLSLSEGAIAPWQSKSKSWLDLAFEPLAKKYHFGLDTPFGKLSEKIQSLILFGSGEEELDYSGGKGKSKASFRQKFQGIIPLLEEKLAEESTDDETGDLTEYLTYLPCPDCSGARLRKEMLFVRLNGKNIAEMCRNNIVEAKAEFSKITWDKAQQPIAEPIMKEIFSRLEFLENVGLSYLTLDRTGNTLSGGEFQRIRLATQIGSSLVGVLYILDEPSIGLHQRDNQRLIKTLEQLRDQGNSVIVVEHDEETIQHADYVVDIGPGAGVHGGEVIYAGSAKAIEKSKASLTAQYLTGKLEIPLPQKRRTWSSEAVLSLKNATGNNLKGVTAVFPLGSFICVSGVSGSGKSTLIIDTLLLALQRHFSGRGIAGLPMEALSGLEQIDKAIYVDQSPIGRTPRSNPATYTGVFTEIRHLFASLPESKVRGYTIGRFSFNVDAGRCEACSGDGTLKISMHFLPDVFVPCEVCQGKRYNRETLEVLYRGKSVADVLDMPIEEAAVFFDRIPSIKTKFQTLLDVGLGYIKVGQSAVTLSGGEAQRIKLARELNKRATGRTVYVLDEPTTGLHFHDVRKLVEILHRLVDQGNTVVVIEHNLDVIKQADHLIDLGPEGGDLGGEIVFQGVPEDIGKVKNSHTGRFLVPLITKAPPRDNS
ncbi:MAG: excinuclease ABC subunit UvrA [Proteobacteria bacterium]|nr:excinuclease ABC subunit UvrA [Pseudomonadota bacterium]